MVGALGSSAAEASASAAAEASASAAAKASTSTAAEASTASTAFASAALASAKLHAAPHHFAAGVAVANEVEAIDEVEHDVAVDAIAVGERV